MGAPGSTTRAVIEDYLEALSRRHLERLTVLIAPDIRTYKADGTLALEGKDAWLHAVERGPFTDESIDVLDLLVDGDRGAVYYRVTARHTGEVAGIAPTGAEVSNFGIKIYRVRDGRIVEITGVDDTYGLLRQLGAVPTVGE